MFALLAVAGSAAAAANSTVTVDATKWVTIPCDYPTTVTYGSKTYTVTKATTLTVEDCGCTDVPPNQKPSAAPTPSAAPSQTAPILANGAPRAAVAGAAGVAAAVAYLI